MEKAMRTTVNLMLAVLVLGSPAVYAQEKRSANTETSAASSPGKASAKADTIVKATVAAVDKATRKITLEGAQGRRIELVASDQVKNFDQIRVGDNVMVRYQEALSLELRKSKGATSLSEDTATVRAAPGERPFRAVGREVHVTAEVVGVDPVKSTISLKGPKGNVVDVKVQNPEHFKVVKTGDLVDAVYTEALAIAVTPAAK
jgi:hypothetical protein